MALSNRKEPATTQQFGVTPKMAAAPSTPTRSNLPPTNPHYLKSLRKSLQLDDPPRIAISEPSTPSESFPGRSIATDLFGGRTSEFALSSEHMPLSPVTKPGSGLLNAYNDKSRSLGIRMDSSDAESADRKSFSDLSDVGDDADGRDLKTRRDMLKTIMRSARSLDEQLELLAQAAGCAAPAHRPGTSAPTNLKIDLVTELSRENMTPPRSPDALRASHLDGVEMSPLFLTESARISSESSLSTIEVRRPESGVMTPPKTPDLMTQRGGRDARWCEDSVLAVTPTPPSPITPKAAEKPSEFQSRDASLPFRTPDRPPATAFGTPETKEYPSSPQSAASSSFNRPVGSPRGPRQYPFENKPTSGSGSDVGVAPVTKPGARQEPVEPKQPSPDLKKPEKPASEPFGALVDPPPRVESLGASAVLFEENARRAPPAEMKQPVLFSARPESSAGVTGHHQRSANGVGPALVAPIFGSAGHLVTPAEAASVVLDPRPIPGPIRHAAMDAANTSSTRAKREKEPSSTCCFGRKGR